MLIDGRNLAIGTLLQAAVVVVGAGPAGITIAEELASAGANVLLVEAAGRKHSRDDDDALDGVATGVPFPFVHSRHRGFGGTSTHWTRATGLRVRQLDDIDFEARPWRPSGSWPFGASVLQPYYDRAHRSIGVESGYDPGQWFDRGQPSVLSWAGGPQLAMFKFAAHDSFVRRFDAVAGSRQIQLVTNSSVQALELSDDGATISGASVVCRGGNRFTVTGNVFVLACGGIDNARILLSSPGRNGGAIGNEHDNVGRYFMDHLSVDTGIVVPANRQPLPVDVFAEQQSGTGRYQAMLWLGNEQIARAGIANAAFWINSLDPAYMSAGVSAARNLRGALKSTPRRDIGVLAGRTVKGTADLARYGAGKVIPRRFRRQVVGMRIMTEQVPNRDSRVTLSPQLDALGMRRVELDWRITSADLDVIVAHQELLARNLEERGIGTLTNRFDPTTHESPIMSNFHHIGTTRMHADPRHGVVDADGRVHSTDNLFVAGSSVFPTGGYVNPTLTIIALAMKTADVVRRLVRSGSMPQPAAD